MTTSADTLPNASSRLSTKRSKRRGRTAKEHVQEEANETGKHTTSTRKAPVTYTDEIGNLICERLRNGEPLNTICNSDDLPTESAVRQWAADPQNTFAAKYARAREAGYLRMADEVIALSDGIEAGDSRFEPGVVQRHRLMVDSRKWLLSKALPKIYGDRVDARVTGPDGGPLQIEASAAIAALVEALPELLNGKVLEELPAPSIDGEAS